MDETQARLREAADQCIKAYDVWDKSKKNVEAREDLQEALHELRKVAARVEIEVAASEREEITQRPIPIPPHRASNKSRQSEMGNELPDFITEGGNDTEGNNDRQPSQNQGRPPQRSGGHVGGGLRRPMRRPQTGGNTPSGNAGNDDAS
ncbi:MAG: hypothetical protein WC043_06250 [Pseudobdellovibrionaceae bacterium]